MQSTVKNIPEQRNDLEDGLKALQKTVSDLQKSFEGWKKQKSNGTNVPRKDGSDGAKDTRHQWFIKTLHCVKWQLATNSQSQILKKT